MSVLITGGTGYIGSHTCVELLSAGHDVVVMDNLSNSTDKVLDGIEAITGKRPAFVKADCCDANAMEQVFDSHPDISAVIHFAASKAVGESQEIPLHYYRNNLVSLLNLLDAMLRHQVHQLVFSSSCTVYGEAEKQPVTEQTPVQAATSPYGNTKQICEEIIADAVKAHPALKAVALRYFNPIGAHQSGLIGELPMNPPQNLVPRLCLAASGKTGPLQVFGDDYDTPDGSCIRDYIHVSDLSRAHIAAIDYLKTQSIPKQNFEIFNIGTGKGCSVLELIRTFGAVNKTEVPHKIVGRRAGDIPVIWADTRYAQQKLGWSAQISIEDSLRSAWLWQMNCNKNNTK